MTGSLTMLKRAQSAGHQRGRQAPYRNRHRGIMHKVSEYDQHAADCRQMAARSTNPTHKKQLEEMAEAWVMLAREREKQVLKKNTPAAAS
jgi:hypothetical protein